MSGKQHKRELRRQKEAVRAAARREERRRTIATVVAVAVILVIGGVLVFVSINRLPSQTKPPAVVPTLPNARPGQMAPGTTDGQVAH
jgi:cell division septal protein FtsQ